MTQKTVLSRQEYIELQLEEACGPENRWYAGECLGHSPSNEEAVLHYCANGGAAHFSEIFIPEDALN